MKGKTKQRVMAVVLTLAMTIGLLPLEFLGGGVTQVKAADKTYNVSNGFDSDLAKPSSNRTAGVIGILDSTGKMVKSDETNAASAEFVFYSGTGKAGYVENTKTFKSETYTNRLETQGAMSYQKACVTTQVTQGTTATIEVVWASGGDDAKNDARFDVIKPIEGTKLGSELTPVSRKDEKEQDCPAVPKKNTLYMSIYENVTAGNYAIGTTGGGYIYSIKVTEKATGTVTNAPTVTNVTAVLKDSVVTVNGEGTAGDEGSKYVIVRVDALGKETEVGNAPGDGVAFSYEDTLTATGQYTYKVYGKGDSDTSAIEAKEKIDFMLPLGTATPIVISGNGSVKISWSAVEEATSYDVKVYQNGTELADKSVTGVFDTSATFEGLTNGTEYGFVVVTNRSTTASDNQTISDEVKATPAAPEVGVTWLNANDLADLTSIPEYHKINDMFAFNNGGKGDLKIQLAGDGVTASDGTVFTNRITTGGGSPNGSDRYVELTLDKDSYIIVYTNSGNDRTCRITNADTGEAIADLAASKPTSSLSPSRAINLSAGKYKIHSTSGGIYIYGIKVCEGTAPRAAWSTVENPVINNVTRGDDGKLTVDFTANIGTDGADNAYVIMYQNGFEAASEKVDKDDDVVFAPQKDGEYTFKVIIHRDGEADKESEVYTLAGYELPPAVPAITWVNNLGNGSVYVDYNNIPAACDVWYKSEGDADYVKAASGVTAGNYTFTGLTAGGKYDFKVTATDEKGTSTSEYKGFVVGEPVQQWYADVFGSATSGTMTINGEARSLKSPGANYTYPSAAPDVTNGNKGTIGIAASSNGKVADSEEGIQIYYTKINPNTENFKMTATFTVTDDSTFNNQSAFGIFAIDAQGVGTKDTKYFNSVSVGSFKAANVPALVCPATGKQYYHANSARLITGYESYDTSSTAGTGRNMDNDNGFSKQPADDTTPVGATYTYTLEKTNTGFICSMEGGGESIVFDDVHNLMVQEDGSIVVGVAAARLGVEITNIQFEKTAGGAEAVEVSTLIEPKVKVYSGTVSGTMDYEFIVGADVDGWLDVFNFATNEYVYQGPVQAEGIVKVPVALKSGYNDIKYAFKADEKIPDLTTYAIVENTHTVTVQQWGAEGETIYTAPNASTGGAGTREEPLDLQTALNHAQPGQTIVMLDGTYYIEKDLTVQRSSNGTADKMITLTAENVGNVVIDGSRMESSTSLINLVGDYWHVYGIEFQNGLGKGISVCGNYNIVEMCKIHHVANTGLQISRYAGEPNTDDMWPSYNLIKYCEAHDCSDPGRSDADGFAAKLTSGVGNKFYGCISHHNIDDGWDLYAKSTTGSIGAVTIENCVAYSNGFLSTDDPATMSSGDFGEGNGFKLGGENMPGAHILKNSISYNNAGKGITSNSGPDVQVINCTAFNNSLKGGAYNVSLYTKTSNPKAWVLDGMLSVAENGKTNAELGSSNGVINSLRSATNYLFDGSKSTNTQGVQATSEWFVSTDITLVPTITVNGIDMHGLLELKDLSLNAGAKFTSWEASAKPEATKTVSTKNVISFVGFNSVALGQAGSVNTGDNTPVAMLFAIMAISAGICGAYVFRRKKSF